MTEADKDRVITLTCALIAKHVPERLTEKQAVDVAVATLDYLNALNAAKHREREGWTVR